MLGENMNVIKKNKECLLHAIKEVGPEHTEVYRNVYNYIFISRHISAGQKHNLTPATSPKSFENVAEFKYLRSTQQLIKTAFTKN
jgi:hypothetical protein